MRLVVIRSALTIAALTFMASAAEAATTDANKSQGTADFSWSTRTSIKGPKFIGVGQDGDALRAEFTADLDPPADTTKPLLSVAMKSVQLQASWSDDKTIQLSAADSKTQDGTLTVAHTLAPHVKVYLDILGFNLMYDYNAQSLLGDLPGAHWDYAANGTATFIPWAMTNYGILKVTGPSLQDAVLVSKSLESLIGAAGSSSKPITGSLAFSATTEPTFNYATTEINVGGSEPLTKGKSSWSMPTTDQDYLEIPTSVKGQVTYSGVLQGKPNITITSVAGFSIPGGGLNFPIGTVGSASYDSSDADHKPIDVQFPAQMIHIPLPNVHASNSLDLGDVKIGDNAKKQSEIKNTGELEAVLSIKSSDPQFTVQGSYVMKAKDSLQLDVTFTPQNEGPQSADITVTSNDPNEPVQKIHVTGNGSQVTVPPTTNEPTPPGPAGDSGCGCRTTPAPTNYGAFGVFGLAALALVRRRRR